MNSKQVISEKSNDGDVTAQTKEKTLFQDLVSLAILILLYTIQV